MWDDRMPNDKRLLNTAIRHESHLPTLLFDTLNPQPVKALKAFQSASNEGLPAAEDSTSIPSE